MTFLACALLLSVQKTPDRELQGAAAKCGSEIPWTRSLEEAREQSRSSGKPIAWWVSNVEGSPMDRKQVIENYMLSGPFMMAGVVDLLGNQNSVEGYGVDLTLEFKVLLLQGGGFAEIMVRAAKQLDHPFAVGGCNVYRPDIRDAVTDQVVLQGGEDRRRGFNRDNPAGDADER
jgi:hypothetical protein